MKIKAFATAVLLLGCAVSNGAVTINFFTASSSIKDHLNSNIAMHQTFIAYWSLDQSLSGFNNADPLNPTGGDIVLGAFDITAGAAAGGRITGHTADAFGAGTAAYSPGYVYIAVFEYAFASYSGSIASGTYYGLGPIYSQSLTQQFPTPGTVDNYGQQITAIAPVTTSLQVVPEPSTVALMLAGLGVLGFSRIRRK